MTRPQISYDVVIAGAGIAAAATALRVIALGLKPLMLARTCRVWTGVEAIPASAMPLFKELHAESILEEAGATLVQGFENYWDPGQPRMRSGDWIHVERDRLAAVAIREALRRGASFRVVQTLPVVHHESKCVRICLDGTPLRFDAAIDATGRAAIWSRPIRRRGNEVADLYDIVPGQTSATAKILRVPAGWAYSIGSSSHTSVAILSSESRRRQLPDSLMETTFGISESSAHYCGRRPAFTQWSDDPINGRKIAVGDAALAYNPLAGQGIRFALSSAITASSVVNTRQTAPSRATAAERFYRSFVARSRDDHFRFVDHLQTHPSPPSIEKAMPVPEAVTFSDQIVAAEMQMNGEIRTDLAFRLPDGESARWVGGTDLLELRNSLPATIRSADLIARLTTATGDLSRARALLEWCLRRQVLRSTF